MAQPKCVSLWRRLRVIACLRAPSVGPATTRTQLVQQHAATFCAQAEDAAGADLPQFVKDEFEAFLECGILAHGFLRLRCGDCGHDELVALSCKRRGFCPSCGARRMSQTAAHLVEHVIPHVPVFVEAGAPSDDELHALLHTVITRMMKMLTRHGVLIEEMGQTWLADPNADGDEARTLRPVQAAAITYRIAFGPRAGNDQRPSNPAAANPHMPAFGTASAQPCAR